jgi:hypothetical protein
LPEGGQNLLKLIPASGSTGGRLGRNFRARAFGGAPLRHGGNSTWTSGGGSTPNSINLQCGSTIGEGSVSIGMRHGCNGLASKMFGTCKVSIGNK